MTERRSADKPYAPLYNYSVASVSELLLCLKPHVIREIRANLQEREPDFSVKANARQLSELLLHLDEMLTALDDQP